MMVEKSVHYMRCAIVLVSAVALFAVAACQTTGGASNTSPNAGSPTAKEYGEVEFRDGKTALASIGVDSNLRLTGKYLTREELLELAKHPYRVAGHAPLYLDGEFDGDYTWKYEAAPPKHPSKLITTSGRAEITQRSGKSVQNYKGECYVTAGNKSGLLQCKFTFAAGDLRHVYLVAETVAPGKYMLIPSGTPELPTGSSESPNVTAVMETSWPGPAAGS